MERIQKVKQGRPWSIVVLDPNLMITQESFLSDYTINEGAIYAI